MFTTEDSDRKPIIRNYLKTIDVIARSAATKQSQSQGWGDCFAALAMTGQSVDFEIVFQSSISQVLFAVRYFQCYGDVFGIGGAFYCVSGRGG
jgi:hypothetical protein